MNEKVTVYLGKIVEYLKKLDKKKRNLYILILCVCVAAAILTGFLLNYKEYVVLYRNLDTKECYEIVQKLEEMSIESKVENESTIYVDKKDEPKVKLQLAAEGYPKSALNYDIFTKNIDFMTTDYEKTQYNLFQLQERLQSSIKTLEDVNDAIVTITVPDNSLAVLDEDKIQPSASVLLNLKNDVTLSRQQIQGVEKLVAKSVPGLTQENVSIIDQTGAVINDTPQDTSLISTADKIKTENEISKLISGRIATVLEPIYGKDNISVGVNVILDYTKKITEKTEYSPSEGNAGVIKDYDQTYEGPNTGAATGGVPGTEPNTEIPGYETPTGGQTNENVKNQVSVDYLVSQIKEQIQKEGAEIKDVTVSVLIDKKNMSQEEAAKVTGIIANTSGISKDKVELFSTEFTAQNEKEKNDQKVDPIEKPTMLNGIFAPKYLLIYAVVALIIIALLVTFIIIRSKRKKRTKQIDKEPEINEIINIASIPESKEQQLTREIREFSMNAPQITASLLRTMLKGDLE